MIHTVQGFGVVNKAEVDVFPELSCFFFFICEMWDPIKMTIEEAPDGERNELPGRLVCQ